jgi:hypothetical protein
MIRQILCAALVAASLSTGCSTRPREFTPELSAGPAAPTASAAAAEAPARLPPEQAVAACQTMVAAGKRSNFAGNAAATGAGVAAAYGAGLMAAGGGAAAGAGLAEGIAAAVAGGATMMLVAPVAIFGASRMIRAGKEKELKAATARCLLEHGYSVDKWERVKPPVPNATSR